MESIERLEARPRVWLTPVARVTLREKSSYGCELMERLREFEPAGDKPGHVVPDPEAGGERRACKSE